MRSAEVRFTQTEYLAYELLFNAITQVLGENEYRLVDPAGKVRHLFACTEDASSFVQRLIGLSLVELLFVRPCESRDEGNLPTYRVAQDRWLEIGSAAVRIPDPPLAAEEKQLREAVARKRERRSELLERRQALARELAGLDADVAALDVEIKTAESAQSELVDWRRRIASIVTAA